MSRHRRVVWSEGMLLSPQHLQQWDRHTHHALDERLRALEVQVSGRRRMLFDRLDALADELGRRYREGEATVDKLLS